MLTLTELIFDDCFKKGKVLVGRKIITKDANSFGEILKGIGTIVVCFCSKDNFLKGGSKSNQIQNNILY